MDLNETFEKWYNDLAWKKPGEQVDVLDIKAGFMAGHRLGREEESKRWEKDVRELEKDARKQFETDRRYIDRLESRLGVGD